MNLKEKVDRFYGIIYLKKEEENADKKSSEIESLIENLRLGVLKSLMLEIDSNRLIYSIIRNMPYLSLDSEKYDFSIVIREKDIRIDYPSRMRRFPSDDEEEIIFKDENITSIDQGLLSILSALSVKEDKPLQIGKIVVGVDIRIEKEILSELRSTIMQLQFDSKFDLLVDNISIKAQKEGIEEKYTLSIRKEKLTIEKEFSTNEIVNFRNTHDELVKTASIFIKEKRL